MPKYRITTVETIYQYDTYEVEAVSEADAEEIVRGGYVLADNSDNKLGSWEINEVELLDE